jgi:hypothetical protein
MIDYKRLRPEGQHISFQIGTFTGTGWVRGVYNSSLSTPSYIVAIENCMNREDSPYSSVVLEDLFIKTLE